MGLIRHLLVNFCIFSWAPLSIVAPSFTVLSDMSFDPEFSPCSDPPLLAYHHSGHPENIQTLKTGIDIMDLISPTREWQFAPNCFPLVEFSLPSELDATNTVDLAGGRNERNSSIVFTIIIFANNIPLFTG